MQYIAPPDAVRTMPTHHHRSACFCCAVRLVGALWFIGSSERLTLLVALAPPGVAVVSGFKVVVGSISGGDMTR
jgi:hypothetical protein